MIKKHSLIHLRRELLHFLKCVGSSKYKTLLLILILIYCKAKLGTCSMCSLQGIGLVWGQKSERNYICYKMSYDMMCGIMVK